MKSLSVIIPSYNVELYLARCLDSLLYDESIFDDLDIIVVNDGSKDGTLALAEKYKSNFPEVITVIDKENGGHGSTINAGLKVAKGKYLKVIDADDWVNIWDFEKFVKDLRKEEADLIITDFTQDTLYDETIIKHEFYEGDDTVHPIEDAYDHMQENNFFFMHAFTVKVEPLRKVWGNGLLEKTFYVDQQYDLKVFDCAQTYKILNYDIYRYFIGRPEQSMNNIAKHCDDHQRVILWLMDFYNSEDVQNKEYLRKIAKWQMNLMLDCHRHIYLRDGFRPGQMMAKRKFKKQIKARHPQLLPKGF